MSSLWQFFLHNLWLCLGKMIYEQFVIFFNFVELIYSYDILIIFFFGLVKHSSHMNKRKYAQERENPTKKLDAVPQNGKTRNFSMEMLQLTSNFSRKKLFQSSVSPLWVWKLLKLLFYCLLIDLMATRKKCQS